MSDFNKIVERTLGHEGGYVDDDDDPGGETNWGISKRKYPDVDIRNLTRAEAIAIYKRDYFDPLHLGEIRYNATAWKIFDIAVNMGVDVAAIILQRALGVKEDGIIGAVTIGEANKRFPDTLMDNIIERQAKRYAWIVKNNPKKAKFLVGWMERCFDRGGTL